MVQVMVGVVEVEVVMVVQVMEGMVVVVVEMLVVTEVEVKLLERKTHPASSEFSHRS